MANLKVSVVVRITKNGKRSWITATGKNDPAGPMYLRWYEGSSPRFKKAGSSYDEAESAQLRQERKLKAHSQGFILPNETPCVTQHKATDCLTSYINHLRATTKRNGRRYSLRSIDARENNIIQFITLAGKMYVEQYDRSDLLRYKAYLYGQGKVNDTVINKLMVVTTWLKHNHVVLPANLDVQGLGF